MSLSGTSIFAKMLLKIFYLYYILILTMVCATQYNENTRRSHYGRRKRFDAQPDIGTAQRNLDIKRIKPAQRGEVRVRPCAEPGGKGRGDRSQYLVSAASQAGEAGNTNEPVGCGRVKAEKILQQDSYGRRHIPALKRTVGTAVRKHGADIEGGRDMTDREKELVNRYVYEVTKRIPKEQRNEIEMELRELIEDMAEGAPLEEVFVKLGDPAVFARKYREDKNYVISPEYFDNYVWVMKIAIACIWAGLLIATAVKCFIDYQDIIRIAGEFISDAVMASLAIVGTVTLIFAFLERQKIKVDLKQEKPWSPDMLSPIPNKKSRISRGDCIASLIFLALFSCLLIFAPQLIGAYSVNGRDVSYVPVFNLGRWDVILPVLLFAMAVGFFNEIIRLIYGCYCKMVLLSSIVTNCIGIVLAFIVLKLLPFWNANFAHAAQET